MKRSIIAGIAIITLILGVAMPVYFSSVSRALVVSFSNQGNSAETKKAEYLSAGKIAPAQKISNFIHSDESINLQSEPEPSTHSHAIGGPSLLLHNIAKIKQEDLASYPTALPFLIKKEIRKEALKQLENSINQNVQIVLDSGQIGGWHFFMPISSSAGAPLQTVVMATAIMVEEQAFTDEWLKDFRNKYQLALTGSVENLGQIEAFYTNMLTLLNKDSWAVVKEWTISCSNLSEFIKLGEKLRNYPSRTDLLFTATVLTHEPNRILEYITSHPENAWDDLDFATRNGSEAIIALIESGSPLYRENSLVAGIQNLTPSAIMDFMIASIQDSKTLGMIIKILFLVLSGLSLSHFLLLQFRTRQFQKQMFGIAFSADLAFALFYASLGILVLEPVLLQNPAQEIQSASVTNLSLINLSETQEKPMLEATNIHLDKVSIIILLLFFLAQLAIYYYSLLKIADIRKQDGSPNLKLKLLENEENLFDAGLYVGLGGTVASLILLVIGVLNASLIAAYASTLFGILFVAILKIFNVRPFRNTLIMAQEKITNE